MAWLDDHPPRTQQFRCPRRRKPSGIIGVHTAESYADETGPDTGAENVADFIRRRTNYGSYHLLADSDSIIQLVRFECVAYHIGTHSLNEHTIGISAAAQAAKWNAYSKSWRDATVRNMARAAARAATWLKKNYGITVPARRISLSQALAGQKGFLAHGDADPARRTDPGATFPWTQFLSNYAALMRGESTGDWFDMATKKDLQEVIEANNNNNANRTWREKIDNPLNPKEPLFAETYLRFAWRDNKWIMNNQAKQLAELAAIRKAVKADPIDGAELAQQVAPLILPAIMEQIEGVSDERIEAALERVIRDTFGELAADGEEA